jgi:hypothetical protein
MIKIKKRNVTKEKEKTEIEFENFFHYGGSQNLHILCFAKLVKLSQRQHFLFCKKKELKNILL